MAKCTCIKCPMQVGYKVDECNHKDCPYRTEPITNADRIRSMTDEELAEWLTEFANEAFAAGAIRFGGALMTEHDRLTWLQQPCEGGE